MKRRFFIVALFLMASVSLFGCETTKGIGTGIDATAKGLAKDTKTTSCGLWNAVMAADDWIKRNLW